MALVRNFALGGAAVCLAVVTQILQVGASDAALTISIVACAVAMPLWIFIAFAVEYYVHLGPPSFPHFVRTASSKGMKIAATLSSLGTAFAIGGVFFHMLPVAGWIFVIAVVAGTLLLLGFHYSLANWWFGPGRPGERESGE